MVDQHRPKIIEENPIKNGLDSFRASFKAICTSQGISPCPDSLGKLKGDALDLLLALQGCRASRLLRSGGRGKNLFGDLSTLSSADHVYTTIAEATPPPRSIASSLQQTPWLRNTSGFANSSEHRKYVDLVLREELGTMYVGLPGFHKAYFGRIVDLDIASRAIFQNWFADISEKLAVFAESFRPTLAHRRPLAQPNKPIQGSTAEQLKSNPSADIASKAWLDLGRYAREVLTAQDTRRFVLGFTICGSLMRIWMFDRLGGIASERFDINYDGLLFVSTILRFLWIDKEELGFDPTITTEDGKRLIMITRNGQTERLVIDHLMKRAPCQFVERDEEGELLQEATGKDVVNVARYYHHKTVIIRDQVDDIRGNTRRGLDATEAKNYRLERSIISRGISAVGPPRTGRSSTAGVKRSSSQTGAPVPPCKRSYSASATKASSDATPNRVHRRIILHDYGKAIYKASSPSVLLTALDGYIEGHESLLLKADLLHRDISINNLMINEDNTNPSGKTGTRAFMAIGALLGEQHSFMHDLDNEGDFLRIIKGNYTPYYESLVPWVNRLRKAVFPNNRR
ncbi:hypothetical protein EV126DRAFT_458284 [Verticillium dahliae]|nr:hypothetical protein EV126DRAFT_458284 [Verticillium dahliae]